MKNKWTPISSNFSEDEVKSIVSACWASNTTRSKLVHSGVAISLLAIITEALIGNKNLPLPKLLVPEMKKIFNKDFEKKLEDAVNRIQKEHPKLTKKLHEQSKIIDQVLRPFVSHNKRGAPKQKPGKRGRPKI